MPRRTIHLDTTDQGTVTATILVGDARPIVLTGTADDLALIVAAQIHALCDVSETSLAASV